MIIIRHLQIIPILLYFTYYICLRAFLNGAVYKTDADLGACQKHQGGHMDFIQLSTKFNICRSWSLIWVLLLPCNITQGKNLSFPLGSNNLTENEKHREINCNLFISMSWENFQKQYKLLLSVCQDIIYL